MKTLWLALLLSATVCCAQSSTAKSAAKTKTTSSHMTPAEVHRSALVVDTHADTTQRLLDSDFDMANPPAGSDAHIDFAKAKAGNLGAEFFSIWVEPSEQNKGKYAHRTLQLIDAVYRQAEKHPDQMMMAFSPADIEKAHRQKKLAALMGIEGGHSIENDMALLRDYYRLGVRYMTITWSNTNEFADSSGDVNDPKVQHHDGLTQFGREVIREMNRLGMMVDISHVSDKTFWDTLTITRAPVIASHSSARALTDHPRNMTDKMLKAVGENGGVVMVNFFSSFIDNDFRVAYAAQSKERNAAVNKAEAEWKAAHPGEQVPYELSDKIGKEWAAKLPRPPLKALIDHIDHIAKVAGIDHVGLGSDFDGVSSLPAGIDSAADLPKITEELMKRGYTAADMKKILGGNIMRVFGEVEKMRDQMKAEGEQAPLLKKKDAAQ
jgi:membrane dipeptidase